MRDFTPPKKTIRLLCPTRQFRLFQVKTSFMMRLTTVILMAACLQISAAALPQKITLSKQNASLEEVFREIRKQSGYLFLYNNELLQQAKPVSIRVTDAPLEEVLALCFRQQPFSYTVVDKTIVVKPKKAASNETTAPPINITGKVTDEKGAAMPGTSVGVKGTSLGTATDADGNFNLTVPGADAILVFSFIGYDSQEIPVGSQTVFNVAMKLSTSNLDEVIVIGYGTQKKSEQTAAISSISGEDILKSPVSDVTNALVGRTTGVFSQQRSGRPGDSGAQIFIRGRASTNSAALVIVDGVERQGFGDIDPNEIESISVLKDASSTALFGIKGANGVIIVTTKSGKEGKPKMSYSGNVSLVSYTALPEFLDSYNSAFLHNEAEENLMRYGLVPEGYTKLFTPEDLEGFRTGSDPLLYPNVNWYKAMTRPNWLRTQHNLNFSGGSKMAKYFVSVGYMFEDGMFKNFNTPSGYRTTPSFTRYNFRSNLDFNLTKTTTLSLRLAGRLENRYSVSANATTGNLFDRYGSGTEGLISRISAIPSWGIPFFPEYTDRENEEEIALDDTYNQIEDQGRLGINTFNPYALMKRNGYVNIDNNAIESIFVLDQKLNKITKGLGFKATFAYDAYIAGARAQEGNFTAYELNRSTREITPSRGSFDDPLRGPATARAGYIKTNLQLALNYAREFGKHNVSAVGVAQRELRGVDGGQAQAPYANQGLVLRGTYNYDERYYFELNGSYNGSENYPKGERYGLFPAVSAGWTLSEEKFMKGIKWLDYLKIRGSYGLIGYSSIGKVNNVEPRFLYLDEYSNGGATPNFQGNISPINNRVFFGNPSSPSAYPVVWHSKIGNPEVTWEKSIKRNVGLETSFFKDKLLFTADLFDEKRYDILLSRNNSALDAYGENLPFTNYGENYNKGYELEATFRNTTGDFEYSLFAQLTHAANKVVITDEPINRAANLKNAGLSIGQYRGYKVIGFYQSLDDIANSPASQVSGSVIPGDFKYADINGDNVINDQDRVPIGYSDVPRNVFGIEPSISYKGISLSALIQGVTKVSSNLIFDGNGRNQYFPRMLGRWTPENTENPTWPAMRPGSLGGNPSYAFNSFLLQDASYVRLRNIEVSYLFPAIITQKLNLASLRIFINGQNLVTWTKLIGLDPESDISRTYTTSQIFNVPAYSYPVTKFYNFGVNVQF